MKSLFSKISAVFFTAFLSFTSVSAQIEQPVNTLGEAVILAESPIWRYDFQVYHLIDDAVQTMSGTLDERGWVTSLFLEKVNILEDGEVLPGIPFPASGLFARMNVYISAYSKDGTWLGSGNARYDTLLPGQPIELVLKIGQTRKTIKAPVGQTGYTMVIDGGKEEAWWDDYEGGFHIWVDYSKSFANHTYEVFDENGNLADRGVLSEFYEIVRPAPDQENAFFSIMTAGKALVNKEGVNLSESYVLDGTVTADNKEILPAKVFTTTTRNGTAYIHTHVSNDIVMKVYYVYKGEPVLVGTHYPVEDNSGDSVHRYINTTLPKYELPAIIVLIGTSPDERIWINISHSSADGGGEKG